MIMPAVRPVDLVEVEIVRLQAPQAGIDCLLDRLPVDRPAIADMRTAAAGDLACEHDVLALAGLLQPAADELFGTAVGLGAHRRGRVKLGGVEEIDPGLQRMIHLLMRLGLGVLRPPGHRSEADLRHGDVRAAQCIEFHEVDPVLADAANLIRNCCSASVRSPCRRARPIRTRPMQLSGSKLHWGGQMARRWPDCIDLGAFSNG